MLLGKSLRTAVCVLMSSAAAWAGTVTISTPGDGATVSSPFRVTATATSSSTVRLMQIYIDGVKKAEVAGSKIDKSISASLGTRRVTVQGYDGGGAFKKTIYVKVGSTTSTSSGSTSSSSSKTFYNIDQMSGWSSCSACAGAGGDGPIAQYSMKRGVSSPSKDGSSAEFFLGGSIPYANALWWKQLGRNDGVYNFRYELYYYIKSPSASQALEFDVNHSVNDRKYIYGTECDFKGTKVWKVYDAYNRKWMTTSIPCNVPKAYTWHHVVLEFKRANGKMNFITVTINGNKHYFNRSYAPHATGAREVNVAFQMDGNKYQTDYRVWLDKVKLTIW
jgi:hypothetical protein